MDSRNVSLIKGELQAHQQLVGFGLATGVRRTLQDCSGIPGHNRGDPVAKHSGDALQAPVLYLSRHREQELKGFGMQGLVWANLQFIKSWVPLHVDQLATTTNPIRSW